MKNKYPFNILDYIPKGKKNAISNRELQTITHLDRRDIQRIIRAVRLKGVVICGFGGRNGGYFIPETLDEVIVYVRTLKKTIISIIEALKPAEAYIAKGGVTDEHI